MRRMSEAPLNKQLDATDVQSELCLVPFKNEVLGQKNKHTLDFVRDVIGCGCNFLNKAEVSVN